MLEDADAGVRGRIWGLYEKNLSTAKKRACREVDRPFEVPKSGFLQR
jgi:hypothetical protein